MRFRNRTGFRQVPSCCTPPDNARYEMCEGGRAGSSQHPHGRVCQAASYLGQDLTQSLSALRSELEASSEALLADMLNVLNLALAIWGSPG